MVEVPILIPCKIRNTYRKKVTLARIVFQWKPNAWLGTMCLFSALFINLFFSEYEGTLSTFTKST